jgi:hypothetical protein
VLNLKPKRVIFNPGTESPEFAAILTGAGIEVIYGCTLIMISNNLY